MLCEKWLWQVYLRYPHHTGELEIKEKEIITLSGASYTNQYYERMKIGPHIIKSINGAELAKWQDWRRFHHSPPNGKQPFVFRYSSTLDFYLMKNAKEISKMLSQFVGGAGSKEVYRVLTEAAILHAKKNAGYGKDTDVFGNFNESRLVKKGLLNRLQYAATLMEKQDEAIWGLLFAETKEEYTKRGGYAMLEERLFDGLVYRALIIAMMRE